MKHTLLLSIFVCFYSQCIAQFSETISTDRPGQTFGSSTLGGKVLQLQTGVTFIEEQSLKSNQSWVSNTFLRYGLTESFDIEVLVNWRKDNAQIGGENVTLGEGFSNTQIGFKYNIFENNGWIPALAFQGRVLTRWVGSDYERESAGMLMNFATSNELTTWLSFAMNIGVTFPKRGTVDYYLPSTFNFSSNLNEKWGVFVEMFGNLNNFNPSFDGGFSFLVTPDFMLDASAGVFRTSIYNSWFVDAGLSYRLKWRD